MFNQGDTIGIIALSGDCEKEKVEQAKANIESMGFKVKLSKNIFDKNRYLAGSDEDKISELHRFFEDDEIKLILCARGGYGAIRLINKIDYNFIKSHQKYFCGFSDVTALLLMFYKKTGMVTYHAPMACTDFCAGVNNNVTLTPDPSLDHLALNGTQLRSRPLLDGRSPLKSDGNTLTTFFNAINNKPLKYNGTKIYNNGFAEGIIWGGNLSTVVSLCGLDFIPDKDFIFFTEDLNEPVYKTDKMFQQLLNIPQFTKHCKGIVLGDFLDTDNEEWLDEYFSELAGRLNLPIASGFKITHAEEKITIPIGKNAKLEGNLLLIN